MKVQHPKKEQRNFESTVSSENKMKHAILSLLSSSKKSVMSVVFDNNVSLLAGGGTGKIYF